MGQIERRSFQQVANLTNAIGTTPEIEFDNQSDLMFYFDTGYLSSNIDIYAYDPASAAYIDSGLNLTVPSLPGMIQLPVGLFPCTRLKLVTDQDDSARTVGITGK